MRRTPARPRPGRATDRRAIAVTGLATAVVVMTFAVADGVLRSTDPGTDLDRRAPLALALLGVLLLGATFACWVMLPVKPGAATSVALALALVTAGWWAGWVWLADAVRALVLALPVLATPALAGVALRWYDGPGSWAWPRPIAFVATTAAVLHAVAYDPFADVDCLRTCGRTRTAAQALGIDHLGWLLELSTFLAVVAVGLALAAVLASRGSAPVPVRIAVTVALVVLGTGVVLDGSVSVAGADRVPLDLAVVGATSLVAIAAGASTARLLARRRSADLLIRQLQETTRAAPVPADVHRQLPSRDLTPAQRLALTNARLDRQARTSLAETRAAQQQVIRLADDERVRIERDLHDGAQQLLVTAALHVSVARSSAGPAAGPTLARVRGEVMDALGELRRISHGPFPSVLLDEGLVAGLEELVAEHGGNLVVYGDPDHINRTTDDAAVRATYAVLGEVLAGLEPGADVRLDRSENELHVTISSPGRRAVTLSTGTLDRLEASAGRLVDHEDDRLEVWVPCGS